MAVEASEVKHTEQFDLSPGYLLLLWEWLKERIKTIPKSQEEMNHLRNSLPEWVLEDVSDWKLDTGTLMIQHQVELLNLVWVKEDREEAFLSQYLSLDFQS